MAANNQPDPIPDDWLLDYNLTEQQRRFVEAYIIKPNATQAALTAGYAERSAYAQGARLLKHDQVSAALAEVRRRRSMASLVTRDRVKEELARVAFGSLTDLASWGTAPGPKVEVDGKEVDGTGRAFFHLKGSDELTPDQAAMLASIKVKRKMEPGPDGSFLEVEETSVKLHDKLAALKQLCKMEGFDAPTQVQATITGIGDLLGLALEDPTAGGADDDEGEDT